MTVYLAPTYSEDASGGPNISARGTGTTVPAHVNIATVQTEFENHEEGEKRTWDIMILANAAGYNVAGALNPNMKAVVFVVSCGTVPINKYARVLSHEFVGNPGMVIEPYHMLVAEEMLETS